MRIVGLVETANFKDNELIIKKAIKKIIKEMRNKNGT